MRFIALLLGALLAAPAFAPALAAPQSPEPAPVDRNGVLILLRSTLLALDQANKTGNYTVFRDLAAPGFAAANNAAKLGDIFASERRDHLDLSGVAVLEPQLTLLPQIESNGMMRMSGFFPSVPEQVNFELLYQPINKEWRLFGISLNVGPSGPVAPSAAAGAPQKPAAETAGALKRTHENRLRLEEKRRKAEAKKKQNGDASPETPAGPQ